MKNNYLKLVVLCLSLMTIIGRADAKKLFYDSKCWTVNVAGDNYVFTENDAWDKKVVPIDMPVPGYKFTSESASATVGERIAVELTNAGYGKKMINMLTGDGKNEDLLRKLALDNVKRQDIEFGSETRRVESGDAIDNLLSEDYLPILMNNYIVLYNEYQLKDANGQPMKHKDGTIMMGSLYMLFHVDVSKEEAFDIMSSIQDPERYNKLQFPVSFVTWNYGKPITSELADEDPAFAIFGTITRRHPTQINIGKNDNVYKGDLVSVYSQRVDKNGEPYSKRISRARVCYAWDDKAQINFEANVKGNRKNGDIVVLTRDDHMRFAMLASWTPHYWGGNLMIDDKVGFYRSGMITHFLFDVGFAINDKAKQRFAVYKRDDLYKSPFYVDAGFGWGFGKTMIGFFDIMPYFMLKGEIGAMLRDGKISKIDDIPAVLSGAFKIPVGLRLSVNMGYPTKLILEGGYDFRIGIGQGYKICNAANDLMGARRGGLFLKAGFVF